MISLEKKEEPIVAEPKTGTVQQQYFTAEEAMTFMEPRIRAMFK